MRALLLAGLLGSLAACSSINAPDDSAGQAVANPPPATALPASRVEVEHLANWRKNSPDWYAAVAPFRIIGNDQQGIYYVGTEGLGMFFIPTADGHIVLDGGMPDQGGYVADAIRKLGYDPKDIRILLNSHAHLDHSGGLAELKALSGAQMVASAGDRSALEGGFYLGAEDETWLAAPPVKVDRIIADGDTVTLGSVTLTAHITPGHSRGCTSWTMQQPMAEKTHDVLFFCSATVAGNRLVGPPQYDGIVADYRQTFARTRDWRPDVFLANHPGFFGFEQKRARLIAGDTEAFVDPEGFPALIAKLAVAFEAALVKQQAEAAQPQ